MVTPEEIAQAMAVHSADDEPRREREDVEPLPVLVDDEEEAVEDQDGGPRKQT